MLNHCMALLSHAVAGGTGLSFLVFGKLVKKKKKNIEEDF